ADGHGEGSVRRVPVAALHPAEDPLGAGLGGRAILRPRRPHRARTHDGLPPRRTEPGGSALLIVDAPGGGLPVLRAAGRALARRRCREHGYRGPLRARTLWRVRRLAHPAGTRGPRALLRDRPRRDHDAARQPALLRAATLAAGPGVAAA